MVHRTREEVLKVYLTASEKLALLDIARREYVTPSQLVRAWILQHARKEASKASQAAAELELERIDEWRAARRLRRRRARARDGR